MTKMRYDSGVFYSLRCSVISGSKCRVRPGALSIARSVIPHSANYPPFRSLLPQISFRKLLSAFRISANYQHPTVSRTLKCCLVVPVYLCICLFFQPTNIRSTLVEDMASDRSLHQTVADEEMNTEWNRNQLCDPSRSAIEAGNFKRKNPFGSLLSLAWKLCEAEQKRCKLADSTGSSHVADFRTGRNMPMSHDGALYALFQMSTTNASMLTNFQPPAAFPSPLTAKMYSDFENSVIRSIQNCADDYVGCTSYSPVVPKSSSMAASSSVNDILTSVAHPSTSSRWMDSMAVESYDSAPEEEEVRLSERRRHQCHMCSYQTDNRSHMLRHQATAHDACKLYHCYICKMDFSRSERAKSHFLSIHPEIPYHSKIIRKRPYGTAGLAASSVESGSTVGSPGASRVQQPAGASTGPLPGRKSWEKYCRLVPPSGSSGCYFHCIRCSHVGPDIWHLKRHFLSTHAGSQAYTCRVCRYSTGDVQRLIGHMTGHGELFCHQCSFSTVELERFREHLTTCTGESPTDTSAAQCPVCGDHFSDISIVKQHVSDVHRRNYCEHCACVIYGPETIEDHLLQHQAEDNNTTASGATYSGGRMLQPINSAAVGSSQGNLCQISDVFSMSMDAGQNYRASATPDADRVSQEALDVTEEGVPQSKYRFGRFSNQTYYCPVEGCPFKATWKKSIELHTLNYHTEVSLDDHSESMAAVQSASPDLASATAPVAISGLFNCPFCPNCRTFKYRKSYEKHLLQHGVDYVKHPYLVVRSSQRDDALAAAQNSSISMP